MRNVDGDDPEGCPKRSRQLVAWLCAHRVGFEGSASTSAHGAANSGFLGEPRARGRSGVRPDEPVEPVPVQLGLADTSSRRCNEMRMTAATTGMAMVADAGVAVSVCVGVGVGVGVKIKVKVKRLRRVNQAAATCICA